MSLGDMFLKIDGSRSGAIKGEANDSTHGGEIEIASWSWGMRAGTAMGGAGQAAKTSLDTLHVTKHTDSATTALMSVMRSNELLKKAVLTVRKAGTTPIEYLIVTIEGARIVSFDVGTAEGSAYQLVEKLAFSFQKIQVDYYPQDSGGSRKGGMTFTADVS